MVTAPFMVVWQQPEFLDLIPSYLYHLTQTTNPFYLYLSGIMKCSSLLELSFKYYPKVPSAKAIPIS
jgi:hypothetical protein